MNHYQYTFKDGSTIWAKGQFTSRIPPGEKLNFIEAKGEYIKGTGRFVGIKGSFTCKGPYITPYTPDMTKGDLILDCSGTRILPRKRYFGCGRAGLLTAAHSFIFITDISTSNRELTGQSYSEDK